MIETPRQRIPDDDVPAVLEIETVPDGRRMRNEHPDPSVIPVLDVCLCLEFPRLILAERLEDPRPLMSIAVENEHRLRACLDDLRECIELLVMKLDRSAVVVIDRTA